MQSSAVLADTVALVAVIIWAQQDRESRNSGYEGIADVFEPSKMLQILASATFVDQLVEQQICTDYCCIRTPMICWWNCYRNLGAMIVSNVGCVTMGGYNASRETTQGWLIYITR